MNIDIVNVLAARKGIEIGSEEYETLKSQIMDLTGLDNLTIDVQTRPNRNPQWLVQALAVIDDFRFNASADQIEYFRALLTARLFERFYGEEAAFVRDVLSQFAEEMVTHGNERSYNRLRNALRVPREQAKTKNVRKEARTILEAQKAAEQPTVTDILEESGIKTSGTLSLEEPTPLVVAAAAPPVIDVVDVF